MLYIYKYFMLCNTVKHLWSNGAPLGFQIFLPLPCPSNSLNLLIALNYSNAFVEQWNTSMDLYILFLCLVHQTKSLNLVIAMNYSKSLVEPWNPLWTFISLPLPCWPLHWIYWYPLKIHLPLGSVGVCDSVQRKQEEPTQKVEEESVTVPPGTTAELLDLLRIKWVGMHLVFHSSPW